MKRIIPLLLFIGLMLTSCASKKFTMSETEIAEKGYAFEGWDITLNNKVIGTFNNTEWELYKNHLTREVSVTARVKLTDADVKNLIRFMRAKFPDYKIEVNFDDVPSDK
jgi:hypothetical protein